MNELVSIVVPVYNAESYLYDCLESLINQTYRNIEIILVNDGSTDKSVSILEEYKKKDSRIKIITQNNSGVTKAREKGVCNSTGKWICFSDADDIMPLDGISFLANNIDSADIVIGNISFKGNYSWPFEKKEDVCFLGKGGNNEQ